MRRRRRSFARGRSATDRSAWPVSETDNPSASPVSAPRRTSSSRWSATDFPGCKVFVFARNERERAFALELGAVWAGATEETPPEKLHAIIDTTPAWKPVVEALKHLTPGGRLVINAIRKEERDKTELLRLDYPAHLWLEKEIKSVANVTRRDISEFLALAAEIPLRPEVQEYPLTDANRALAELKEGKIRGAKVLRTA